MRQDDSRSPYDASTTGGTDAVPNIPSTQPFNNNAIILMDSIDEALSKRGILAVCKSEESSRASNIIDHPVGQLSVRVYRIVCGRDEELASREAEAHHLRRTLLARVRFPPNLSAADRVIFGHPYSRPPTAAPAGSMSWSRWRR